jgi:putative acetyltransferase
MSVPNGSKRVANEAGTNAAFEPAHNLYRSKGFTLSGPFGSFRPDSHSVFMELRLGGSEA